MSEGKSPTTTKPPRVYVIRVECTSDPMVYELMYQEIKKLIGEVWDEPPVCLSGGMEDPK